MMKQLRRSMRQRFTAFCDHLFLLGENRFTAGLHDLAKVFRNRSDRRTFSKMPLWLELLEPRWVPGPGSNNFVANNDNYQIFHDRTLTVNDATQGVLANDVNIVGTTLSVVSYTTPADG